MENMTNIWIVRRWKMPEQGCDCILDYPNRVFGKTMKNVEKEIKSKTLENTGIMKLLQVGLPNSVVQCRPKSQLFIICKLQLNR